MCNRFSLKTAKSVYLFIPHYSFWTVCFVVVLKRFLMNQSLIKSILTLVLITQCLYVSLSQGTSVQMHQFFRSFFFLFLVFTSFIGLYQRKIQYIYFIHIWRASTHLPPIKLHAQTIGNPEAIPGDTCLRHCTIALQLECCCEADFFTNQASVCVWDAVSHVFDRSGIPYSSQLASHILLMLCIKP